MKNGGDIVISRYQKRRMFWKEVEGEYDESLPILFWKTDSGMTLYPVAFKSPQTLVGTIAHEAFHDVDPASLKEGNDNEGTGPAYYWAGECSKEEQEGTPD